MPGWRPILQRKSRTTSYASVDAVAGRRPIRAGGGSGAAVAVPRSPEASAAAPAEPSDVTPGAEPRLTRGRARRCGRPTRRRRGTSFLAVPEQTGGQVGEPAVAELHLAAVLVREETDRSGGVVAATPLT